MFLLLGVMCRSIRAADVPRTLRAGIIGLDTSHVTAFTKILNDPKAGPEYAGVRVVAAFPAGSPDLDSSSKRIEGFTKAVKAMDVEIVDSIPALLAKVDVVLLESVDGRVHLEQARPVFASGKPVFIDKPLAAGLIDAVAIAALAEKSKTPWFSSSALRFGPKMLKAKGDAGEIIGCDAWGPCPLEKTHGDFYWYGIHGVETLYTIMGGGCESVSRTTTKDTDVAAGKWKDGRIGTFRGLRKGKEDYGCAIFGSKAVVPVSGFEGYQPMLVEIVKFFKTGKAPIDPAETIEMMAFMEAADESKRREGAPVKIEEVMAKAREQAKAKVEK